MKNSTYSAGIGFALLAIAAGVLVLFFIPHKTVIAFYNVPEISVQAITALSQDGSLSGNSKFLVRILDPALSPAAQLQKRPKVDLLFMEDGKAARELAEQTFPPSEAVRMLMPSAMRRSGANETRVYGLPLLLDHFEVAYDRNVFRQTGLSEPKTLDSLLFFARKTKTATRWPIICAGAQIGQLQNGVTFKDLLVNTEFKSALDTLVAWRKSGLLHSEWFRMKNDDVIRFMEKNYAAIVLIPLSTHRTVPMRIIEQFDTIPFPGAGQANARAYTSPVLLGILPLQKKQNQAAGDFLYNLAKNDGQKRLSGMTGLSPVNSTAETQDKQASDVRLWVASAQKPMPDIGTASFAETEKRKQFAREIRGYIESGGSGY
jgi:hypothetical protein